MKSLREFRAFFGARPLGSTCPVGRPKAFPPPVRGAVGLAQSAKGGGCVVGVTASWPGLQFSEKVGGNCVVKWMAVGFGGGWTDGDGSTPVLRRQPGSGDESSLAREMVRRRSKWR